MAASKGRGLVSCRLSMQAVPASSNLPMPAALDQLE
jgi:hypothetical protein